MFLEVVLDWRAAWFKLLWRDCLELYIVVALASRVMPTRANHEIFFAALRPPANTAVASGYFAALFRYLLLGRARRG